MTRRRGLKGMGYVYERGGVWYIAFTHGGREHRESSKSTRKGDAANLLKERIRQMRDGTFAPGASRVRLCDLRDLVLTDFARNGKRSADRMEEAFANLERILGAETPAEHLGTRLDEYTRKRLTERVGKPKEGEREPRTTANATVNRELAALRRGFRLALQQRRVAVMPHFEMLVEPPPRQRFPEPEEVDRILAALPERLQEPMRFLSLTGWRAGEALGLQWRHVDLREKVLRLPAGETKGGEARAFPFGVFPELEALLKARKAATEAWERERGEIVPWVFWRAVEGRDGRVRAEPSRVYSRAWVDAAKAAKCAHIRVHDLRRYVARRLIRAGVSESVAMRLLGHRTRSVFERYNVTDARDLKSGVEVYARACADSRPDNRTDNRTVGR